MRFVFSAEEMNGLNDGQKDAIIDTVIACVLADGTVGDAEVSRFDAEFKKDRAMKQEESTVLGVFVHFFEIPMERVKEIAEVVKHGS